MHKTLIFFFPKANILSFLRNDPRSRFDTNEFLQAFHLHLPRFSLFFTDLFPPPITLNQSTRGSDAPPGTMAPIARRLKICFKTGEAHRLLGKLPNST